MDDYISREQAIKAISEDIMGGLNYERILRELPAADVDYKQGFKDGYNHVLAELEKAFAKDLEKSILHGIERTKK